MTLLIKLFLGHILGDFFLQPKRWVKDKEKKKLAAWQLYAHTAIHFVLIMLLVPEPAFIPYGAALALSHLVIDASKISFQQKTTQRLWFFLDQGMHLFSIMIVVLLYQNTLSLSAVVVERQHLALITLLLFLTAPSSFLVKTFISKWTPYTESDDDESLGDAGKYIGILERLLAFTFVSLNNWEALGFLIAAKSIFRFGDLRESKERKLTEYILIGTLTSFGIAIVAGIVYQLYCISG